MVILPLVEKSQTAHRRRFLESKKRVKVGHKVKCELNLERHFPQYYKKIEKARSMLGEKLKFQLRRTRAEQSYDNNAEKNNL